MRSSASVHLVRGDDPVLVTEAVRRLVDELTSGEDRSLMVEDLGDDRYLIGDDAHISPLVDAAQTPPFLTERRVVVGRHLARFTTAEAVRPLVDYLGDPLPSTDLVLVWDKGPGFKGRSTPPKTLVQALERAGAVTVTADVPSGTEARGSWLKQRLSRAAVRLDAKAEKLLVERLGEDLNRLGAILGVLEGAYGAGATIAAAELEPFLGEAGGVPPWELTDAVAAGDIATALDRLQRMLVGGERHALQVMATLHRHVAGLMKLDGSQVRSREEAAKLLGMNPYPAQKLMRLARSIGSERIAEQVRLLAQADLDLRGASELPDELILEILVARLARLSSAR